MTLRQLASADAALGWFAQRGVCALNLDSRHVKAGDAFIAWPGHAVDGRAFVPQALRAGANACLVEAQGAEAFEMPADDSVATLAGLKAATGLLASRFMGEPSLALDVVACTGTNGKTSMAWWMAQALSSLGRRCGVVGTLGVGEPPNAGQPDAVLVPTGLTTPDPVTLHAAFRRFVDSGFKACAIEASSIGLAEHRLAGTHISVALFSNFTLDHLDFHGSMAEYWQAKAQLFGWPGLRAVVLNLDDTRGVALAGELAADVDRRALDVWTYSTQYEARLRARDIGYVSDGLRFDVHEAGAGVGAVASVVTRLIGDYNVSNVLAVIGGLRSLGVSLAAAAGACATLTPVPGRMQRVPSGAALAEVVVDYAHTPDALEKTLLALQLFAAQRGGRLWCVFGCGGNRDASKRPLMGALAARLAQQVIVTSDNPRLEDAQAIIDQIIAGAPNAAHVEALENRAQAIARAVGSADARDVILIAGKGHEDYQDVGGVKHPFSDVQQAAAALADRGRVAR